MTHWATKRWLQVTREQVCTNRDGNTPPFLKPLESELPLRHSYGFFFSRLEFWGSCLAFRDLTARACSMLHLNCPQTFFGKSAWLAQTHCCMKGLLYWSPCALVHEALGLPAVGTPVPLLYQTGSSPFLCNYLLRACWKGTLFHSNIIITKCLFECETYLNSVAIVCQISLASGH